jgi:biotin carboxyl carrier protein
MNTANHRVSFKTSLRAIAAMALMPAASLCWATDIYRWVDEQGRTHMADAVPERYKASATKINSKRFEVSQSEHLAALERIAKERERLAAEQARVEAEAAERARSEAAQRSAAPAPSSAASRAASRSGKLSSAECASLWREYFKSQECFAPYRLSGGGIKAEAFDNCTQVVSPAQQCGPGKITEGG